MKPQVEIYDTTLRDGSQGEGINFSVADKLRIAEKLDAFGVHYIEGGWPGSNPKDIEFFAQAKKTQIQKRAGSPPSARRAKRTRPSNRTTRCACSSRPERPSSPSTARPRMLHVKEVLRCTPEENLGDDRRHRAVS